MKQNTQSIKSFEKLYNEKFLNYKEYFVWQNLKESKTTLEFKYYEKYPEHFRSKKDKPILVKVLGTQFKDIFGAMTFCVLVSYLKRDGAERKRPDIRLISAQDFFNTSYIL